MTNLTEAREVGEKVDWQLFKRPWKHVFPDGLRCDPDEGAWTAIADRPARSGGKRNRAYQDVFDFLAYMGNHWDEMLDELAALRRRAEVAERAARILAGKLSTREPHTDKHPQAVYDEAYALADEEGEDV